jgi:hypothetical protein
MESEALARMLQLSGAPDNARGLLALARTLMMDNLFGRFLKKADQGLQLQ